MSTTSRRFVGRQVLTPGEGAVARVCIRAERGNAVAFVGDNRRMLIVKLDDIRLMTRGRGVILQRYKSGSLADAKVFRLADGLSWRLGGKPQPHRNQSRPVARRARRCRPPRSKRLPTLEPLWLISA